MAEDKQIISYNYASKGKDVSPFSRSSLTLIL